MRSMIVRQHILPVVLMLLLCSPAVTSGMRAPSQPAAAPLVRPTIYLPIVYQGACFGQAVAYCLTDLPLNQISSTIAANAINNSGQIVGTSYTNFLPEALLLSRGSVTKLGALGGSASLAYDINDNGQVVGSAATGPTDPKVGAVGHAFLWQNSVMADLGTLGGPNSVAYAINNAGQVVGAADTAERYPNGSFVRHAFLWQNGVMTDLGTLGGQASEARDINASGQVVGYADTGATDANSAPIARAFLWQQGSISALAAFGNSNDTAYAINAAGQAVGIAILAGGPTHAVLWQNGTAIDLGIGEAHGINASGQVVGFCCATPSDSSSGTIWSNGQMVKLAQLLDPTIGAMITSANAINGQGQIIVEGSMQSRSGVFLLTPKS
jgi:probable HAF family extracellular repeat protein